MSENKQEAPWYEELFSALTGACSVSKHPDSGDSNTETTKPKDDESKERSSPPDKIERTPSAKGETPNTGTVATDAETTKEEGVKEDAKATIEQDSSEVKSSGCCSFFTKRPPRKIDKNAVKESAQESVKEAAKEATEKIEATKGDVEETVVEQVQEVAKEAVKEEVKEAVKDEATKEVAQESIPKSEPPTSPPQASGTEDVEKTVATSPSGAGSDEKPSAAAA